MKPWREIRPPPLDEERLTAAMPGRELIENIELLGLRLCIWNYDDSIVADGKGCWLVGVLIGEQCETKLVFSLEDATHYSDRLKGEAAMAVLENRKLTINDVRKILNAGTENTG